MEPAKWEASKPSSTGRETPFGWNNGRLEASAMAADAWRTSSFWILKVLYKILQNRIHGTGKSQLSAWCHYLAGLAQAWSLIAATRQNCFAGWFSRTFFIRASHVVEGALAGIVKARCRVCDEQTMELYKPRLQCLEARSFTNIWSCGWSTGCLVGQSLPCKVLCGPIIMVLSLKARGVDSQDWSRGASANVETKSLDGFTYMAPIATTSQL